MHLHQLDSRILTLTAVGFALLRSGQADLAQTIRTLSVVDALFGILS